MAWWVLLLPVAVISWASTLASSAARRTVWGLTLAAVVFSGVSKPSTDPANERATPAATATTLTTPPTTIRPATSSERPATTALSIASTTAPISSTTPSATTLPGSQPAARVLDRIPVAKEHPDGYTREHFPTWLAPDASGCDARTLVLLRESTVSIATATACSATGGRWVSPYDGELINDPGNAQIDHLVSVKEAWDSGARAWTAEQRAAYANDITDLRTLHVVTPAANSSKGDRDPSNWLPPRADYVCTYLGEWLAVNARWGLTMDESEAGRIRNVVRKDCPSLVVGPWTHPPAELPRSTTTSSATTAAATTVPVTEPPASSTKAPQGILTPPAAPAPATRETSPPAPPATSGDIVPGAFCRVEGATATHNGLTYVCDRYSTTGSSYAGDKPHWRRA